MVQENNSTLTDIDHGDRKNSENSYFIKIIIIYSYNYL